VLQDGDVIAIGMHELIYTDLRDAELDIEDSVITEKQD
jgi:hypothetical protein